MEQNKQNRQIPAKFITKKTYTWNFLELEQFNQGKVAAASNFHKAKQHPFFWTTILHPRGKNKQIDERKIPMIFWLKKKDNKGDVGKMIVEKFQ